MASDRPYASLQDRRSYLRLIICPRRSASAGEARRAEPYCRSMEECWTSRCERSEAAAADDRPSPEVARGIRPPGRPRTPPPGAAPPGRTVPTGMSLQEPPVEPGYINVPLIIVGWTGSRDRSTSRWSAWPPPPPDRPSRSPRWRAEWPGVVPLLGIQGRTPTTVRAGHYRAA